MAQSAENTAPQKPSIFLSENQAHSSESLAARGLGGQLFPRKDPGWPQLQPFFCPLIQHPPDSQLTSTFLVLARAADLFCFLFFFFVFFA
jgi:hypothetical protein